MRDMGATGFAMRRTSPAAREIDVPWPVPPSVDDGTRAVIVRNLGSRTASCTNVVRSGGSKRRDAGPLIDVTSVGQDQRAVRRNAPAAHVAGPACGKDADADRGDGKRDGQAHGSTVTLA